MKKVTIGPGGDYATLQLAMNAEPEADAFVFLEDIPAHPVPPAGCSMIIRKNSAGWTVKLAHHGCGTRADGFGATADEAMRIAQRAMAVAPMSRDDYPRSWRTAAELRAYLREYQQQPPPEEE